MLGDKTNIYFKIDDNDLTAIFKDNCNLGVGDRVEVLIYTKNICIFDEKSEKNILHDEVKGCLLYTSAGI